MDEVGALRSVVAADAASYRVAGRWVGLDRLRGLAVLLMVLDHVAVVLGGFDLYRVTAGRLAMPLFFLVAGTLVRWPKPRWLVILALGVALPLVVPWVDSPNVLVLYVIGACALALVTRLGWPSWWLVFPALLFMANGWNVSPGSAFDVLAAVALMALGHECVQLRTAGVRLPGCLDVLGRYPLSIYVGHLVLLRVVQLLVP